MSFKIDFDKKPTHGSSGLVGRFRSGRQVQGLPQGLTKWRVTSDDQEVLKSVAGLLGGKVVGWETTSDQVWELLTDAESLNIDIESIDGKFVYWNNKSKRPIRVCDGVIQEDGKPCQCPGTIPERKLKAKESDGCDPEVRTIFKLTDLPDLGKFQFSSGSWGLAATATDLSAELEDLTAAALLAQVGTPKGTLTLKPIEFTTKAGKPVAYTLPVIKLNALVTE
jgi:hypothetical protein